MRLAIYNRGISFDGRTPFTQPLGGSETSIVHMARDLARCGHDVTVYCSLPKMGSDPSHATESNDLAQVPLRERGQTPFFSRPHVPFLPYNEFFRDCTRAAWDVVVSFRSFDPFLLGRIAPRMIFWTGDAFDQPALQHFGHPALQENIDLIFCVSEWHRRSFIGAFKLPAEKVVATRNGFCQELIPPPVQRNWKRCAYSSTPFRGLDFLLQMFPHMRRSVPALSLDVFSSMKVYGWSREADEKEFGATYEASKQPGVTWHGSIAQPLLMEILSRSGLFLYPNTFAETSCMAAIEAQACGAVVVTSARAALNETVENDKTGICLPGEPSSPAYQAQFISTVTNLFQHPARLEELSRAARDRAFRHYRWSTVASEWTEIFKAMPARRVHGRWNGPLTLLQKTHDYLRNGNVNAASRVLSALQETPFLRTEVDALKGRLSTWM